MERNRHQQRVRYIGVTLHQPRDQHRYAGAPAVLKPHRQRARDIAIGHGGAHAVMAWRMLHAAGA
jgi:hypothetical protein